MGRIDYLYNLCCLLHRDAKLQHICTLGVVYHTLCGNNIDYMRFQVLTASSMMFRIVFWDESSSLMMEAVRASETPVDNHFTRQYIPEDNSKQHRL
jgi:hypothetical protein